MKNIRKSCGIALTCSENSSFIEKKQKPPNDKVIHIPINSDASSVSNVFSSKDDITFNISNTRRSMKSNVEIKNKQSNHQQTIDMPYKSLISSSKDLSKEIAVDSQSPDSIKAVAVVEDNDPFADLKASFADISKSPIKKPPNDKESKKQQLSNNKRKLPASNTKRSNKRCKSSVSNSQPNVEKNISSNETTQPKEECILSSSDIQSNKENNKLSTSNKQSNNRINTSSIGNTQLKERYIDLYADVQSNNRFNTSSLASNSQLYKQNNMYKYTSQSKNSYNVTSQSNYFYSNKTNNNPLKSSFGGGFKNLGLTCYIGSVFAILSHIDIFLIELTEYKDISNKLITEFKKTIANSAYNFIHYSGPVDISNFKNELDKVTKDYKDGQNDAHAFLMSLFTQFEINKLNKLNEIFLFKTKSYGECNKCNEAYEINDPDDNRSCLMIENYQNDLKLQFQLDILFNDKPMLCRKCNESDCYKKITIETLPSILTIYCHRITPAYSFISPKESIPLYLDMEKYVSNKNMVNTKYIIKGVIVHKSYTTGGGHYITYIYYDKRWYEYDDAYVSVRYSVPPLVNTNAFLLFYERL